MRYWWFHATDLGVTYGPYIDQRQMYADAELLVSNPSRMETFSSATPAMPRSTPSGQRTRASTMTSGQYGGT